MKITGLFNVRLRSSTKTDYSNVKEINIKQYSDELDVQLTFMDGKVISLDLNDIEIAENVKGNFV